MEMANTRKTIELKSQAHRTTSRQPSNAGGFRRLAFTKPANDRGKQR